MWSYTKLRNTYGTLSGDSSSANLSLGDTLINDAYRRITASATWPFLEKTDTADTVASQQGYEEPAGIGALIGVTVTVSSQIYRLTPVPNRRAWDRLNQSSFTSDTPSHFWRQDGKTYVFPTPASAGNTITWAYRARVAELKMADYTTGNVSALANGASAVTGSGTSWTAPMAGRFIEITPTDTANQSGDGLAYEISAVGSTTSLTLKKAYGGLTISGNTAYTLGQCPILPDEFRSLPLWDALEVYFTSVMPDTTRAQLYRGRKMEMEKALKDAYLDRVRGPEIADEGDMHGENPNNYPESIG